MATLSRDLADGALGYAAVPRPAASSLMPLRQAPHRPDRAPACAFVTVKTERVRTEHHRYHTNNHRQALCQPEAGWCECRSEIKESRKGSHREWPAKIQLDRTVHCADFITCVARHTGVTLWCQRRTFARACDALPAPPRPSARRLAHSTATQSKMPGGFWLRWLRLRVRLSLNEAF